MTTAPGPIPLRALVVLTTVVLAVHGLVVHQAALGLSAPAPLVSRVFTTRIVQIKADPVAAVPVLAPVAAGKPEKAAVQRKPKPAARTLDLPAPAPVPPAETGTVAGPPLAPEPAPTLPAVAPEPVASVAQAAPEPEPVPVAAPQEAPSSAVPTLPRDAALAPLNYTVPGSVLLKFDARGQRGKLEYHASGQLAWLHDGRNYEARLELGAFLIGSRVLRSTGQLTADGLAPNRFSDKFRSEVAAHFNRERGRVTFSANTPEADLQPGAQDQLSVFVQLAAMVGGDPGRYAPGTTITMQTVSSRMAEPWTFSVDAPEQLLLPGGDQATLKLTRLPRREFDQKVELWLAPALAYLPARIRITQTSGDYIDQQWRATSVP